MKWNSAWIVIVALGLLVVFVACEDDDEYDVTIGSACSCVGEACLKTLPGNEDDQRPMPSPDPAEVTFVDCEPEQVAGAQTSCFLSYEGNLGPTTYYEGGLCAISSASCEGSALLCAQGADYGDYDTHEICPAGRVMLRTTTEMANLGMTVHSKICVPACEASSDCRTGYDCIDKDGVKFCYDERNISGEYEAELFE